MTPTLSKESWKAAQIAAERAIPRLIARGHLEVAANLSRRAKQFAERSL
jgi:hypothetical protein